MQIISEKFPFSSSPELLFRPIKIQLKIQRLQPTIFLHKYVFGTSYQNISVSTHNFQVMDEFNETIPEVISFIVLMIINIIFEQPYNSIYE